MLIAEVDQPAAAVYFLIQGRQVLTTQEATNLAIEVLKAQGPATVKFHTGAVEPSMDDKPGDPHYRLLEKAGVVKLGKAKGRTVPAALTPKGEALLLQISGVKQFKEKDGMQAHVVPLAERRLITVSMYRKNKNHFRLRKQDASADAWSQT